MHPLWATDLVPEQYGITCSNLDTREYPNNDPAPRRAPWKNLDVPKIYPTFERSFDIMMPLTYQDEFAHPPLTAPPRPTATMAGNNSGMGEVYANMFRTLEYDNHVSHTSFIWQSLMAALFNSITLKYPTTNYDILAQIFDPPTPKICPFSAATIPDVGDVTTRNMNDSDAPAVRSVREPPRRLTVVHSVNVACTITWQPGLAASSLWSHCRIVLPAAPT
ncbi:hypothetical protein OG21DRAFT_1523678 [Imleria badia]|nr:hypothetical protein OG21DRAFT_1523678 [Imleria badia]